MNVEKIKSQVRKAISKKPTTIRLFRNNNSDDGMSDDQDVLIGEIDIFFNDNSKNINLNVNDSGRTIRVRNLSIIAVTEDFEIKVGDFFCIKELKHKVIYPGEVVQGVYNADVEVIR